MLFFEMISWLNFGITIEKNINKINNDDDEFLAIEFFAKQWEAMAYELYQSKRATKIIVKKINIPIPRRLQFTGVHYYPWYIDVLARIYAWMRKSFFLVARTR